MKLKLTAQQRAGFFQRDYPKIAGEGECPIEVGYVHRLSSRVSFEVTKIRRNRKGQWSLDYTVNDQRGDQDLYLLPTAHSIPVDDKGNPLPMTRAEERGYTGNPRAAIDTAGNVPHDVQTALSLQGRVRTIEHHERERAEELARKQIRAVAETLRDMAVQAARTRTDITPLLADIRRRIDDYRELDEAA